jgi:hypothetical protein
MGLARQLELARANMRVLAVEAGAPRQSIWHVWTMASGSHALRPSMQGQVTHLHVPAGARLRKVNDAVVGVLDGALARGGAAVTHAFDAKRRLAFEDGGPPLWSVGRAETRAGVHQLLTYGLSRAVDPSRSFSFELTMRIVEREDPTWAILLLRGLARYQQASGREIRPGRPMALGAPITRAMVSPSEGRALPYSPLDTIVVLPGATIATPGGPLEVRNVYAVDARGRELVEVSSSARFVEALAARHPSLAVDRRGETIANSPAFADMLAAASAREDPAA